MANPIALLTLFEPTNQSIQHISWHLNMCCGGSRSLNDFKTGSKTRPTDRRVVEGTDHLVEWFAGYGCDLPPHASPITDSAVPQDFLLCSPRMSTAQKKKQATMFPATIGDRIYPCSMVSPTFWGFPPHVQWTKVEANQHPLRAMAKK